MPLIHHEIDTSTAVINGETAHHWKSLLNEIWDKILGNAFDYTTRINVCLIIGLFNDAFSSVMVIWLRI